MISRLFKSTIFKSFATVKKIQAPSKYSQTVSKARTNMPIYNMSQLVTGDCFIAPNATLIGQVFLGNQVTIWHGTIIRGDINQVLIHGNVSVGNNCVLHTAASVPSGLSAQLSIQEDVVIQNGCTLYSCTIRDNVHVGANSVILQGAIIQKGAIILPNSVVPPGRVVPAMQVWGGNPIKYIRNTAQQQSFVVKQVAKQRFSTVQLYRYSFLPFNNAYLYRKDQPEDLDVVVATNVDPVQKQARSQAYNARDTTVNF